MTSGCVNGDVIILIYSYVFVWSLAGSNMSSTFRTYKKYYVDLIQCLPMDDVIFTGKLFESDLLPNDLKASLESLPTSTKKATNFLDNVIGPSIRVDDNGQFFPLLKIMEESGYETVKKLAGTIMFKLNHRFTTDDTIGDFSSCIYCVVVFVGSNHVISVGVSVPHGCVTGVLLHNRMS